MLQPTYPGVYTLEAPSGVRSIAGVATAVAAFIGPTKTGIDNRARRVLNYGDFERAYGGLSPDSELSYGLLHFFQNGGGEAFVVRVPKQDAKAATLKAKNAAGKTLEITALGSGVSGNDIVVDIESVPGTKKFSMTVSHATSGLREVFSDLSTEANNMTFAPAIVNDPDLGSELVKIAFDTNGDDAPLPTGTTIKAVPPAGAFTTPVADATSFKVSVARLDAAGAKVVHLAEVDVDLFAAGEAAPVSLLALAKKIEDKINEKLLAISDPRVKTEIGVLEFGTGANKIYQLRARTLSTDLSKDGAIDAVIEIKDGAKPPQGGGGGGAPPPTLFKLFGLEAAKLNASRYRLGSDYAKDTAVQTANPPTKGVDGSAGYPTEQQLKDGIDALDTVDLFNIVCIPDAVRPQVANPETPYYTNYLEIYSKAEQKCRARRAFLLLDPPPNLTTVDKMLAWKTSGGQAVLRSDHAATYFPRLKMSDPLNQGSLRQFPPSGAMAGVLARTDANRGVWKSPAGIDASIANVYSPALMLSDEQHGLLNPVGVNCVRQFPIYGSVAFGARTLAGADAEASQWKYVAVRRTAHYILESLRRGLTWVTFEPNDEPLWGQIRMNVGAFMQGMFRQGAFQGKSPREAYLVKCDRETTPQSDVDLGIVNIVVGFAPLKPAEFVFVTLQQLAGQAQN
jgi:phage tail sheath protein FI